MLKLKLSRWSSLPPFSLSVLYCYAYLVSVAYTSPGRVSALKDGELLTMSDSKIIVKKKNSIYSMAATPLKVLKLFILLKKNNGHSPQLII